jgi:type I restriction enzyme S subunit
MSEIKNIPKGWTLESLVNDLPYLKTGVPEYKGKKKYFSTGSIKSDSVIEEGEYSFSEKPSRANRIALKGDVLQARMKATDKAILIDSKLDGQLFSTGFFQIRPIDGKLNSSYILHYLTSLKFTQIKDKLCSGSTQSALNDEGAKKIFIPIPPFKEQELIVSKIQELLSELENGKQQLLTAQQQLKVYRQSLLKWAFEGKLTNKKVKDGELPKGWKWVKSGELFSFVTSGSRGWAKYYSNKGAIFIRITNMNFDTLELDLRDEKIQYVNPPSNSEGIRTKVQEGDFLFSITGYLGMFAIAPKLENAFVNQHVCLCRPKEGFNKKYVGYWISSRSGGIHHLNKNQKGAVKAGLNLDDLKTFPVPLCSPEEQQLIVDELESKLTVCDKIEETINQSLQQAESLRQSIFKQAFEGKLV